MNDSIYSREETLRTRLNSFLSLHLSVPERDYYAELKPESFLALKSVLADINNILTLKVSLSFANWVSSCLHLEESTRQELLTSILSAKPNSNGFDIWLGHPIAFVAEVKCNVPINGGKIYGSAQRNGIKKDISALLNGKTKASINPNACLKFLAFLDLPEIRGATDHFLRSDKANIERLVIVTEKTIFNRTDVVYVVYVTLDNNQLPRVA